MVVILLNFPLASTAQTISPPCQYKGISNVISPDQHHSVLVREEICGDGGYITTASYIVQIVRNGDIPQKENTVFAMDAEGNSNKLPVLINWLSPSDIEIVVPNKSLIALKKDRLENININVKFNPNDPAERKAFLKQLGLPTE